MAKDKTHEDFKIALEKEGWQITHDPLRLPYGSLFLDVDLERKN